MPHASFTIRRKVLTIFGAKFHIYNDAGALVGFSRQKALRLREDIRIYTDESQSTELLAIRTQSVIDFGAAYAVIDSTTGSPLGALRRKGLASILRDSWIMFGPDSAEVGRLKEENAGLALLRRFLPFANLIPQRFALTDADGRCVANFRTHFNPFVHRLTVTIDPVCQLNPYLVLAAGILLVAIEGRQQ